MELVVGWPLERAKLSRRYFEAGEDFGADLRVIVQTGGFHVEICFGRFSRSYRSLIFFAMNFSCIFLPVAFLGKGAWTKVPHCIRTVLGKRALKYCVP